MPRFLARPVVGALKPAPPDGGGGTATAAAAVTTVIAKLTQWAGKPSAVASAGSNVTSRNSLKNRTIRARVLRKVAEQA